MRIWKIFSDIALLKLILENAFLLHYNELVCGLNTHIRRRIEAVITGRTRNAFGGQLPRGFESLRLRFIFFGICMLNQDSPADRECQRGILESKLIGVNLFGQAFPDWFGTVGKAMYTLFQVMTLESWSMGISRPVMEVYSAAWLYFVPFVLISSFIVMNVVVGIVVNSISEVTAEDTKQALEDAGDEESGEKSEEEQIKALTREVKEMREMLARMEQIMNKNR